MQILAKMEMIYECQYCNKEHRLVMTYDRNLPFNIDIIKETIESAIQTLEYEMHKLHGTDPRVSALDTDRLHFCEI